MVEFIKEIGEEGIATLFDKLTIDDMLEIRKNDGFAEGCEEGLEEGREEGHAEEKLSIAKNLLKANADINLIASATGLPIEEIEKLK